MIRWSIRVACKFGLVRGFSIRVFATFECISGMLCRGITSICLLTAIMLISYSDCAIFIMSTSISDLFSTIELTSLYQSISSPISLVISNTHLITYTSSKSLITSLLKSHSMWFSLIVLVSTR